MPWKAAGLTGRQAAAHLLDRFTFGTTAGEIDEVVKMGLEKWFVQQLDGNLADDSLQQQLAAYDAMQMDNQQLVNIFPRGLKVIKEAAAAGINKDSMDKATYDSRLKAFMQQKGYRYQQHLYLQFISQKILSAAYSNNQLHQVLTDFWFNHFNVSATKINCMVFIPVYERDAIRPNVTGKFYDLLLATAQSPAMLFYLDNFSSAAANDAGNMQQQRAQQRIEERINEVISNKDDKNKILGKIKEDRKNQGLNENYAREIMELHTLGVDGGYTQKDVTAAARVLTGWTVYPLKGSSFNDIGRKIIDDAGEDNLLRAGFVHHGDFFFAMNRHDQNEKTVLGKVFPAGGGYNEGLELLGMLARHPSTAKFISKKLAVRFVSDDPPQSLIDRMAASFIKSDGDIKQVLITMVSSPEFWAKESLREKTKSPFEYVISTVRSLHAKIDKPFLLYEWISKMGQPVYYYQVPTGFPDRGQYWINTGSLLNRMKFGLAFATRQIPGISFSLAALNNNREPESAAEALKTYSKILLPERDLNATIARLEPLISDQSIQQKITDAANKDVAAAGMPMDNMMNEPLNSGMNEERLAKRDLRRKGDGSTTTPLLAGDNDMLSQVVGIIIGSPEFQRR